MTRIEAIWPEKPDGGGAPLKKRPLLGFFHPKPLLTNRNSAVKQINAGNPINFLHEDPNEDLGVSKYRPVIRSVGVGYPGVCPCETSAQGRSECGPLSSAFPISREGLGHEEGEQLCVCVRALRKMGQKKSKSSGPMGGVVPNVRLPQIPPDSPLGLMIKHWDDYPSRKGKNKVKMIHYCIEVWGGKQIRGDHLYWPVFGSFEDWVCQALNIYVNSKEPFGPEESEYAHLWIESETRVNLYPLRGEKQGNKRKPREEDEVPASTPTYVPPAPPPVPTAPNLPDSNSPDSSPGTRRVTRSWAKMGEDRSNLYPLREVAMGGAQPGMGYVSIPLNSGDVREFKKEMRNLLEDPLGVSERIDQFLGPNIYTWEELQAILAILFTAEERKMIRRAGMRIWDQQHQQGPVADTKWPLQKPNWNNQNEVDRGHMQDLRTIIVQGIRESVPRGQNINKAFNEHQKKDETPTEWLERLRKSLQLYSGLDLGTPVGQALLKTQFVAKSWTDIRKKLEKMEDWQDKGLDELLREAQKVYVRREEETHKKQARMLVAAVREGQRTPSSGKRTEDRRVRREARNPSREKDRGTVICFYCERKGHIKKDCRKRITDEKMFKED